MNKILRTRLFGEIEVKKVDIIEFTKPIIGFDDYKQYILLSKESIFPTFWLQSVDNPNLAFPVVSPFSIHEDYSVKLQQHDYEDLLLKEIDDLLILTLLVVPQDLSQMRTNLKAPIVYNPKMRIAKQVILQDEKYPINFYVNDSVGLI